MVVRTDEGNVLDWENEITEKELWYTASLRGKKQPVTQ